MWQCQKCGERSEDQFDACWKCAAENTSVSSAQQGGENTNEPCPSAAEAGLENGQETPSAPSVNARSFAVVGGVSIIMVFATFFGLYALGDVAGGSNVWLFGVLVIAALLGPLSAAYGAFVALMELVTAATFSQAKTAAIDLLICGVVVLVALIVGLVFGPLNLFPG